jgi:hypothetical protein
MEVPHQKKNEDKNVKIPGWLNRERAVGLVKKNLFADLLTDFFTRYW